MDKFKSGDVVILKSGGPRMTVKFYANSEMLVCQWFVDGKVSEAQFHQDQLEKYEDE